MSFYSGVYIKQVKVASIGPFSKWAETISYLNKNHEKNNIILISEFIHDISRCAGTLRTPVISSFKRYVT